MHPTTHQPPTAYNQIRRLLLLLALAVGSAIATVGLMVSTVSTERTFVLGDVLIAPELLSAISLQDTASPVPPQGNAQNSSVWHFDKIELSLNDPITHRAKTDIVSIAEYAKLYESLIKDASISETERNKLSAPSSDKVKSIQMSIWLINGRTPPQHRLLQTVVFLPEENRYRVQLYQLGSDANAPWATFHHAGLSTLLQTLTQDTP